MTKDYKAEFEKIYEDQGTAPWTFEDPPKELVDLVESEAIKPCRVLDIGCGEGFYSIYLASRGFIVTSIDRSERAIVYAKQHAKERGVNCNFLEWDFKNLNSFPGEFDFIFDWRFLHEILDEPLRRQYVEDVDNLLAPRGRYLSVSFNGDTDYWGGGTIRESPVTKVRLYFGKLDDMEQLFRPHFRIIEKKLIQVPEKYQEGDVPANYLFMEKAASR